MHFLDAGIIVLGFVLLMVCIWYDESREIKRNKK